MRLLVGITLLAILVACLVSIVKYELETRKK